MVTQRTLLTAEQFLAEYEGKRCELVRGEVVKMSPVGPEHGRISIRLGSMLLAHVDPQSLGEVYAETGFRLACDPDVVRAPDLAFVSRARLLGTADEGWFEGAPDLAVEVLSPGDRASEVIAKVQEYLRAGTTLVVVVDPQSETIVVHHPGGESRSFTGGTAAALDPVLPGLALRPAELFRSAR